MRRKTIGLLLCAGLVFGILTGCGSEGNADTAPESTAQAGESAKPEESENAGDGENTETAGKDPSEQTEESAGTTDSYLVKETIKNTSGWNEEIEYDASGNSLRHIYYDPDGDVTQWYVYEYDADGNKVREISYYTDDNGHTYPDAGSVGGRQEYEYDEFGNMTHSAFFNGDSEEPAMSEDFENEYDADNRLIGRISRLADGTVNSREEYEYDSAGNRVKEIGHSGSNDELITEVEYDTSGNIIRELGPSGGRMPEYDAFGNLTKVTTLDENGNATGEMKYDNEYDDAGNLVKQTTYDEEGRAWQWEENEYDPLGNLIKKTCSMEESGVFAVHEYEYALF